jgi:excisionase family DNA binding protein
MAPLMKRKKMNSVDNRTTPDRRVNPDRRRSRSALNGLTQVFNTSEACLYLRISRPTFLKLITAGKIRAKKIGKGWRVLETELERFLLTGEMARQ